MHHLSKDVRAELRYVLIGEIVCSALICVVFALLHRLDYTVPLGAVWGSFFALLQSLSARPPGAADLRFRRGRQGRRAEAAQGVLSRPHHDHGVRGRHRRAHPMVPLYAVLVPFLAPQPIMMIRRAVRSARARRDDTEKKGES